MKQEKGFTLIELLAVIVILAIIALIATPLAINVIENARKNAFKNTAYGLIDAVKLQYAENYLNGNTDDLFYTFPEATGLSFSGERPKGGTIRLTGAGTITYDHKSTPTVQNTGGDSGTSNGTASGNYGKGGTGDSGYGNTDGSDGQAGAVIITFEKSITS